MFYIHIGPPTHNTHNTEAFKSFYKILEDAVGNLSGQALLRAEAPILVHPEGTVFFGP